MVKFLLRLLCLLVLSTQLSAQGPVEKSTAQQWNEQLLEAIRNDFARPVVHARNLFHLSLACYDAWAVYDTSGTARPLFLGQSFGGFEVPLDSFPLPQDLDGARREAMSYAAYRLLRYRFRNSPHRRSTWQSLDLQMLLSGYDRRYAATDYRSGNPAALGNYLASKLIEFGITDGANDANDYRSEYYLPYNPPLVMDEPGNPDILDPDRWQPLTLEVFVDQSGNPIDGGMQEFLGPEWGNVVPFALKREDSKVYRRGEDSYRVYHDPGPPPLITQPESRERYQRGFEMVVRWGALLDPNDGVLWDISPGERGRYVSPLPEPSGYYDYYMEMEGGDSTGGLPLNPHTERPYPENLVKRGDYSRVLAEFWADGPDSETPPGHWFVLANKVLDHPQFVRRWKGQGPVLPALEYDVKLYLTLGAAMHDAAIATWSVKGWYDYIRPVSAFRYMAKMGQRSDPNLPNYHPHGLALEPGFIEFIDNINDPLAGERGQYVGELKVYTWLGPGRILNPETDVAGVGWMRAKDWWPYQRATFVTPPFAGYVSGHSTYSRAAAEVLTAATGSEYFPGGIGEFVAPKNEFLLFERGPSDTVVLQWAKYRDAADESGLSRIFGGIHPPADDIPGRRIGGRVAADVIEQANKLFDTTPPFIVRHPAADQLINKARVSSGIELDYSFNEAMDTTVLPVILTSAADLLAVPEVRWLNSKQIRITLKPLPDIQATTQADLRISGAQNIYGRVQLPAYYPDALTIDTEAPAAAILPSHDLLSPANVGERFVLEINFTEDMDTAQTSIQLFGEAGKDLLIDPQMRWTDGARVLTVTYQIADVPMEAGAIGVLLNANDAAGNQLQQGRFTDVVTVQGASGVRAGLSEVQTQLYPNPVRDYLILRSERELSGQLQIYDMQGRLLHQQTARGRSQRLPTEGLISGQYQVVYTDRNGKRFSELFTKL